MARTDHQHAPRRHPLSLPRRKHQPNRRKRRQQQKDLSGGDIRPEQAWRNQVPLTIDGALELLVANFTR